MKKHTLFLLTIAVVFAPLTALAQKIQRQITTPSTDAPTLDRSSLQINHNAYGVPLQPRHQNDSEVTKSDR